MSIADQLDAQFSSNGDTAAAPATNGYGPVLLGWQPNHLAILAARGINPETAAANKLESTADHLKLGAYLNRKWKRNAGGAIVFPYVNEFGDVAQRRVRPDNPRLSGRVPVKYESPVGAALAAYFPVGVRESLKSKDQPAIITEGEFKAICSAQHGFPAISIPGVDCWHRKKSSALLPDLERVEWKGRRAFIVFDSDGATNPNVADNVKLLAAALQKRGADVKVVWLPPGPDGAKVGLDDYLVANGPSAFAELLRKAEDPERPDAGELRTMAKEADPATEAAAYLEGKHRDGVLTLRHYRGTFFNWQHGAYREVTPADVRSDLIQFAARHLCHLGSRVVGDFFEHLKAQAHLASWTEPPAWLSDGPAWPADEILATRGGLIHLPSVGTSPDYFRPATPTYFATNALEFDFDPQAPQPAAWLEFLSALWNDDPQSVEILQMWAGYLLVPDTRHQKILLLVGPKRSGKGTIFRILAALVGRRNVCGPTLASLACNFGLQPMLHKTVAMISDARLSGRTDSSIVTERLLSISGEDSLTVDRKHLEAWTGKLAVRLMMATNELPRLSDSSGALASRFIVLRLKQSWYGQEDTALSNKLAAELPGILLWAMHGWRKLRDAGRFPESESAEGLRRQLDDLTSPVGAFVRERCAVNEAARVARADLYAAYVEWCKTAGRSHVEDEAGFGRHLRAAVPTVEDSYPRVDGKKVRHYVGIGMQSF